MTLLEHLGELRRRLAVSLIGYLLATGVVFGFRLPVFRFVERPYCKNSHSQLLGHTCALVVTGPVDAFLLYLHLALLGGALLSAPVWLWQLWAFITPGLYRRERRWGLTFVGLSLTLFTAGAVVAYLMLGRALGFLLGFGGNTLATLVTADKYLSFLTTLVVVFGVAFEFPLLVVALNFAGIVSHARLRSWRRMEIFLVTVFAAVATPTQDPFTMLALAAPMWLLYEAALLVCRLHDARAAR
ncbi:MAG TPA: twin-arginine translocase subunit TatC [Mycobacteriales bacterium]|nr:twin-arginine translocase subunit TatC [Mycobacteriales bacterium]